MRVGLVTSLIVEFSLLASCIISCWNHASHIFKSKHLPFLFCYSYLEKKGEKNHNENGGRSGHIFIFLAREFIRSKKGHRRAYQRPRNGTPASKSHSQVHKKWRRVKSDDHQPRSRGKYTELIYKLSFNIEKW